MLHQGSVCQKEAFLTPKKMLQQGSVDQKKVFLTKKCFVRDPLTKNKILTKKEEEEDSQS